MRSSSFAVLKALADGALRPGPELAAALGLPRADVSLAVRAGEMVALLGANGAGKSTAMQALSGLLRPVEGSIILDDDTERIEVTMFDEVFAQSKHVIAKHAVLIADGQLRYDDFINGS